MKLMFLASPLFQCLHGRAKAFLVDFTKNAHFITRGPVLPLQSVSPKRCVEAPRRERGTRGGGVPGSCPPRFLRSSGLHSCSCSQSSYVCALESEELQPALPGGEKGGPRKESSGGEGGGRGADAPRGPPTVALGVRRARASRHPLSLSPPLCSSPGAA